jgi:hypothetical protein
MGNQLCEGTTHGNTISRCNAEPINLMRAYNSDAKPAIVKKPLVCFKALRRA